MSQSGDLLDPRCPPSSSTLLRTTGLACAYLVLFLLMSCIVPLFLHSAGFQGSWAWSATTLRADVLVPLVALPVFATVFCGFLHALWATHSLEQAERRLRPVIEHLGHGRIHRGVVSTQSGTLSGLSMELDGSLSRLHDDLHQLKKQHGQSMKALHVALDQDQAPADVMESLAESMETVNETLHRLQLRPRHRSSIATTQEVVEPLESAREVVES